MTGPDGAMWGAWRFTAVDPPTSLEFINAFADTNGTPVGDLPTFTVTVRLTTRDGGTRMEMHSRFESPEGMEWMVSMGTVDGLQQAIGQIDSLLA
jgi:Activator of Hsp90 ATPase homolog 1-like protein